MSAVCPLLQNISNTTSCLSFSCMRTRQVYIWACQNCTSASLCLRPALKHLRQPHINSFFSESYKSVYLFAVGDPRYFRSWPCILPQSNTLCLHAMFLLSESEKPLYISLRAKSGHSSSKRLWPSYRSLEFYQHPLHASLVSKKGIQQVDGVVCKKKLRIVVCRRKAYISISTFPSGHPKTINWDRNVFCSLLSKRHIPLSSMKIHG